MSPCSSMDFAWRFQASGDLVSAEARLEVHHFDEGQCIGTRWHPRTEAKHVVGVISIPDDDLRTLVAMGKDVLDGYTRTSMTLSHELNGLGHSPLLAFMISDEVLGGWGGG